jgi:aminoglycoside phosphotransferase (APT) family kinase protein
VQPPRVLKGGFVNDVYGFEIDNAPTEWSRRLVLRLYPDWVEPKLVRRERCAQDVVSAQGVPAPRVLLCEDTPGVLDRPFMVMERLPGRIQLAAEFPRVVIEVPRLFTQPRRHAPALAMVHALDSRPLLECFAQAGITEREAGPSYWLDFSARFIEEWSLDGLRPGLEWLRANEPPRPPLPSICHGDLFGGNILEERGRITGILDWNLATVAAAEFDVGGQLAVAQMSPVPAPPPIPWIALAIGRGLARGLRKNYPEFESLNADWLRYYAAGRAFTEMTFKLRMQARIRATGVSERMPTWRPAQCARYFRRRTGVALTF